MIFIDLPVPATSASFQQESELDGVVYRLAFRWNARSEVWTMTLADAQGDVIRSEITLVRDFPLLRRIADERKPPGDLFLLADDAPTLERIGDLVYFTRAEIESSG